MAKSLYRGYNSTDNLIADAVTVGYDGLTCYGSSDTTGEAVYRSTVQLLAGAALSAPIGSAVELGVPLTMFPQLEEPRPVLLAAGAGVAAGVAAGLPIYMQRAVNGLAPTPGEQCGQVELFVPDPIAPTVLIIPYPSITATSIVMATFASSPNDNNSLYVTVQPGVSFTIGTTQGLANPTFANWWIVSL
jgi:hypothetical protein